MAEVTVIKETVHGDRMYKEMSDGTICVENVGQKPKGAMYGDYIKFDTADPTPEMIAEAKAELVDRMCELIRKLADEREELFIIKKYDKDPTPENYPFSLADLVGTSSVGIKIIFPTIDG